MRKIALFIITMLCLVSCKFRDAETATASPQWLQQYTYTLFDESASNSYDAFRILYCEQLYKEADPADRDLQWFAKLRDKNTQIKSNGLSFFQEGSVFNIKRLNYQENSIEFTNIGNGSWTFRHGDTEGTISQTELEPLFTKLEFEGGSITKDSRDYEAILDYSGQVEWKFTDPTANFRPIADIELKIRKDGKITDWVSLQISGSTRRCKTSRD